MLLFLLWGCFWISSNRTAWPDCWQTSPQKEGASYGPDLNVSLNNAFCTSYTTNDEYFGKAVYNCIENYRWDPSDEVWLDACYWYLYHCDTNCSQANLDTGSSCFPAGTQVSIKGGKKKNIEDVLIGDEVDNQDLTRNHYAIRLTKYAN